MRHLTYVLVLLIGCARGAPAPSSPSQEAAVVAPTGAAVVAGEDGKPSRATFAVGFVMAVAGRDDAAIAGYTDPRGFCTSMAKPEDAAQRPDLLDKCVEEIALGNEEALGVYRQAVAETFAPGESEEHVIDEGQGIYMVTVRPLDGGEEDGVVVMLIELGARRYVVFPRKK